MAVALGDDLTGLAPSQRVCDGTALLPQEGVRWAPLGPSSARATVTAGATAATVDFHFGADGLVERIYAASRGRDAGGGRIVPTPWQGHFSRYELREGYHIPTRGEVEWLMPDGPVPYWRGEIVAASFLRRSPPLSSTFRS